MNILIAVPTFETIYPDTFKSIYELDKGGHKCTFDFVRGYDCATARNNIATKALNMGVDYVLMVDNDVVLPSDALINLLDIPADVCLGYYAHRNAQNAYSGKVCVCRLGEINYTMQYTAVELIAKKGNNEFRELVHGGGMGCALIKTDVFNRLAYPWFDWVNYENRGTLSEDLYFCEMCKKSGIPIYVDTRVGCGHIFRRTVWPM